MQTLIEIRITDSWVKQKIEHIGQDIGYGVMKLVVDINDELFYDIREILNERQKITGSKAYISALIRRKYTRTEIETSRLLRMIITTSFEPCGEELGTTYSDVTACSICGSGRIQTSDLVVNVNSIPKNVYIAQTIAKEILINNVLANILTSNNIKGYQLNSIHDAKVDSPPIFSWYQLQITGNIGPAVEPTVFGIDPLDLDMEGKFRCPLNHVAGLNLISELYVDRNHLNELDIYITSNLVGQRSGLLSPFPLIIISQRLYSLLKKHGVKGYKVEVVHTA